MEYIITYFVAIFVFAIVFTIFTGGKY